MADDMKLHLQRVHFGIAPPDSLLKFSIAPDRGFAVRAVLDRDSNVVAQWEFEELKNGELIEETLVPKGVYTLTLHIAFTETKDATVGMSFELGNKKRSRTMIGKKPDIGRTLAVVFIQ